MGMKILNSYRLSDFYEYVDETLDIYSKTIKVKMLKNINISDYTSSKGLKKLPKATKNAIVSSIACTNNILTEEEKKERLKAVNEKSEKDYEKRIESGDK